MFTFAWHLTYFRSRPRLDKLTPQILRAYCIIDLAAALFSTDIGANTTRAEGSEASHARKVTAS